MALNDRIMLSFGKKMYGLKLEIEKRADDMNMSASKYCIMILSRHVQSGEKLKVTGG